MRIVCDAPVHTPWSTKRPRCVCPESAAVRTAEHRADARRRYIRGRAANRRSRRHGYDWAAVERAIGGDRDVVLTIQERAAAIDRLTRQDMSAAQIARRLGITTRTVCRYRAGEHVTPTHHREQEYAA